MSKYKISMSMNTSLQDDIKPPDERIERETVPAIITEQTEVTITDETFINNAKKSRKMGKKKKKKRKSTKLNGALSPTERRSKFIQDKILKLRSKTNPKTGKKKLESESQFWRRRIEDLSSIGSTKPESNGNTKKQPQEPKNSKIQCPVWNQLSKNSIYSPHPYFMTDLLGSLKGSRTVKGMLYHEYFIQNTKFLAVMNLKKIIKPPESEIEHLKVYFPPRTSDSDKQPSKKRTLILDLDETLIHCFTPEEFDISPHVPDLNLQITGPEDSSSTISISIRPYAYEFLDEMSKLFEIAIFTASSPLYANKILDILDPNNQIFVYRIFR